MHILSNSFEFFFWFTKVDDLEHSFDVINSKPKPLAAYLFTKDHKLEKKFVKTVSAGGMLINDAILQVTFPSKIAEVTSLRVPFAVQVLCKYLYVWKPNSQYSGSNKLHSLFDLT